MEDCDVLGKSNRRTLGERFARIAQARTAVHPITIQLSRKLKVATEKLQNQSANMSSANTTAEKKLPPKKVLVVKK